MTMTDDPTLDEFLDHLAGLPELDLWDIALGAGSDPVDARLALETLHGRARSRSHHTSTSASVSGAESRVDRMAIKERPTYQEKEAFRAELHRRASAVKAQRQEAEKAEAELRDWAITEWRAGRSGLTAQEIAAALGVSKARLYQIIDERNLA